MRKLFSALVLICSLTVIAVAQDKPNPALPVKPSPDNVAQYLQDISVTIRSSAAEGSGVVTNINGVNYVWTAAHVVDDLRTVTEVIDPKTGTKKNLVKFKDAEIVKELVEDGRKVGQMRFLAEVLRFSSHEGGEDLAVLRVRKKNLVPHKVFFHLEDKAPSIGTKLFHVGSLHGQGGSNSMTDGIYSQVGRLYQGVVYDQTTCPAFPGSSGGGVFMLDGSYCGMIVRGTGETFNLIVPARRMKDWAKKAGVLWAMDYSVPVPSDEELAKLPAEDVGASWTSSPHEKPPQKENRFLIRPLEQVENKSTVSPTINLSIFGK